MHKKGQVSIFVVIGIVIVVLVVLFLLLRSRVYIGPATQQDLELELVPIKEHIEECLIQKTEPKLRQIGLQGGYIVTPENSYRSYQGNRVSYLCYNIKDKPYCRQRILRISDMEHELERILKEELTTQCINIQSFNKIGTNLQQGQLNLKISIGEDNVNVVANLPVTISKGNTKAELKQFSTTLDVPLGRLYNAARDILNTEATIGDFDTLLYSLAKTQLTNKLYVIQKMQPYPDKLYIMKIKDVPSENNPYIFQFFVEGEPR